MASKEQKVSSKYYDIVDPISKELEGITKEAKRVVDTGINIQSNFRYVAIGLRRITRRTSMKVLSSALSFATPIDIEGIVEDITSSAMTTYRFVKNSGLLPLFSDRLRYYKYEEQDLSEFLDDVERLRDIMAEMEFDRIDMMYSIDVIKGAEKLISAMGGLKSKSFSGAQKMAKTGMKLTGVKGKLIRAKAKTDESQSEKIEAPQTEQIVVSSEGIKERLSLIKKEWPEFKAAVDEFCNRLEPLLAELNKMLGLETKKKK